LGKKGHRRHLSNYLLDKSLQLRYIVFVTVVSALLCGALGYLVWQQEDSATQNILNTLAASEYDEELKAEIIGRLTQDDSSLVLRMVGAGIGMVLVLSMYLLIMTHKVAGPLYKVSRYFDEMHEGKLSEVYPLRKGDQLVDFYDKFKSMHDTLRARHQSEMATLDRFLGACAGDSPGDFGHKLEEAKAYLARRQGQLA
jgi:hypothetical protein